MEETWNFGLLSIIETKGTFEVELSGFCIMKIAISMWGPMTEGYYLDISPHRIRCLHTWSPAVEAVWE